jgi:hypothetical protein
MNLVNELLAHFKITDCAEDQSGVARFTTGNLDDPAILARGPL